jgi:CRISPR-associated protein Csd2
VYLFEVTNGNPNGDPDAGNLPRVDPETMHGLVTDVCIKRKIRDYVAGVLGRPIFIQSETALNTLYYRAAGEAKDEKDNRVAEAVVLKLAEDADLKKLLDSEGFLEWLGEIDSEGVEFDPEVNLLTYFGEARRQNELRKLLTGEGEVGKEDAAWAAALARKLADAVKNSPKLTRKERGIIKEDLRAKYFDIRMFGAVLTAGTNAGQVRGPMQLTFARSIDPIQPVDVPITRVAITKPSDLLRKQTEMGRKAIVPYGLYRLHGFYNPMLARRRKADGEWGTIVTEKDLEEFWEALTKMFEFDRSAARGEMVVRGLYVFTHESEKGDAPAHRLFELVKVKPRCVGAGEEKARSPRSFQDYVGGIEVPEQGPVVAYPKVTLTRVVHDAEAPRVAE